MGHGQRARIVEGPLGPGEAPTSLELLFRRYRCRACKAVIVVLPRGVGRGARYLICAIAYALALWGHAGATASATRSSVSAAKGRGFTSPEQWSSLRRWSRDAARLLGVPLSLALGTLRARAADAARWLASFAPTPTTHVPSDAYAGAAFLPR